MPVRNMEPSTAHTEPSNLLTQARTGRLGVLLYTFCVYIMPIKTSAFSQPAATGAAMWPECISWGECAGVHVSG